MSSVYDDIDPVIGNQQYAIISYVLPEEHGTIKNPMLKIRGSYKTVDECRKKIKSLQLNDTYFHYYVIDIGQWGCLLTEKQSQDKNLDVEHINKEMDDFMKAYRKERDENSIEFERRRIEMSKQLKYDGSADGQEILSKKREHFIAVKHRLLNLDNKIKELTKELDESTMLYTNTRELYDTYTEEEIAIAEQEFADAEKNNK